MAERESWGSWLQYLFSIVGSLVGLGNIWRFPYICHRNGGGAFLLPFCVCMLVCGVPIGLLEIAYCQYSSLGPGKVWIVCPLFKGIWFGMLLAVFVISVYYTMLMAWILYYLAMAFSPSLPWASCDNAWNTQHCFVQNFTSNLTDTLSNASEVNSVSSQEEYWLHGVLDRTSDISDLGDFRWEIVLCLLAAWVATLLCLVKGVQAMGKIAYVAATLPYFLLVVLLVRGLLLPGSTDGVFYLFYPDWAKILDYTVWRDAATQLFFSAGYGIGVMSTLASYNKFNNNCYRDALLLPVLDTVTSVFASTVIFAYMGYMAHISGKDMDSVVQQGPGLVFIAYPTALQTLPLPQLWSVLFFLMLFCTGLDSQFCHIQALSTALVDYQPNLQPRKTLIITGLCVVSFLLGLPLTTQGGIYILNLIDWYIASISIMAIVVVELIIFGWIYGIDRLYSDIQQMIGYRIPFVFRYALKYVTPLFTVALLVSGVVNFQPIGAKNPGYHAWSDVAGLVLAFLPIIPIPVLAVVTLYKEQGSIRQRVLKSIKPTDAWKTGTQDIELAAEECLKLKPQMVVMETGASECRPSV